VACSGSSPADTGSGSSHPTGPGSQTSSSPAPKGAYTYENAGLNAEMKFEGNTGTLSIKNDTGHDLGKPDFYLLDARTGQEVDGKVDAAAAIPDGQTKDFKVEYPPTLEDQNIGMVFLLLGGDNYGGFVPPTA
jgi:hypothetical protein